MTLVSRGYSNNSIATDLEQDWQLFCQNIDLLLNNEQKILNCTDYFFCNLSFSYCSWPYVNGDGPLFLSYLLLGWQKDILTENCPNCKAGMVLITSFGGSPLTGSNGWTGICHTCRQKQKGKHSAAFRQWLDFVLKLRQSFPDKISEEQEYDSQEFTFGGTGLRQVRKKKTIWKPVADPVTLAVLIEGLKAGTVRDNNSVNVSLLKKDIALKLSSGTNNSVIYISLPG